MAFTAADVPDQTGRTIVVTGANSGIGLETTRELARNGATVVMACRSPGRGEAATADVREAVPDADLRVDQCDLADLESVRAFAHRLAEPIDVLITNAGTMAIPREETADGFETQFGVNHLGHFALTGLVLETAVQTGVDYAVSEEPSGGEFDAVVSMPVPPAAVEPLLSALRSAGLDDDAYIVVTAAETVVSNRTDDLDGRFGATRISREELRARAADLAPATSTYVVLLVVSTVIATAGLLIDSAATIIGAMVVAPLMGPALAASVGVVVDDEDLATRGVTLQVGGVLLTIGAAAIFGWLLRGTVLLPPGFDVTTVPQIQERTSPNALALVLALGSGVAGIVSLTRDVGSVLVGVAIAVALVPPGATAGLGIAWGHPTVVVTAGTLLLVNLLSINLTALIILWLAGYRPHRDEHVERVYGRLRSRVVVLFLAIAVLSVVLGVVTLGTYQSAAVEHDVQTELEAMSDDPALSALEFRELAVDYDPYDYYTGADPSVTVLVERPPGEQEPPDFADEVRERLEDATGDPLEVTVELVDTQRSG